MERALSSLYEAALSPDYWPEAVVEVGHVLGGGAALVHAPLANFSHGQVWMHEVDPETYRLAPPELLSPEHNAGIRAALDAPGRMVDRRQFLPDGIMAGHPINRQFFEPNRVRHLLIGLTQADEEVGSLFVLTRRDNQPPFDESETALAQNLAGHVGRAMRLYRTFRLAEAQVMAFGMAVEHMNRAVVLVDGDLRILHANEITETLLAAGTGIARRRQRLQLTDPRAQNALEVGVRGLIRMPPTQADFVVSARRLGGRRPFRITAYPAIGDAITALSPRGRVLVIIDDPERVAGPSPEDLTRGFGLTQGEARVAILAAQALSVADIAARLAVSENTVKTQIKAIYLKTGARSRAEFVQLLRIPQA